MDKAKISSVPEITANHPDAMLIHEAAIGRINNDQLLKLMTLGIAEEDAQDVIIQGFLK
jgi:Fe-S cluster assembly scaffold protein SufB